MVGGTVIFTRSFNPHDLLRLIKGRRVSVLVCVPKMLDVLREHVVRAMPEAAEAPRPGISIPGRWWRYRRIHSAFGLKFWAFVVGAAPLPPELEEFWRRMGFAVIQGYGLTETAPIVTLNHPFKTSKGSVGTPIAGVEVRIADDGEILVRGENVTSGYYVGNTERPTPDSQRTQPSAESPEPNVIDAEGWLHTGDIGDRDEQGRLFIKGRKKEMIVTPEGLNVFPGTSSACSTSCPGYGNQRWSAWRRVPRNACTRCWCSSRAPTRTSSCATRTPGCRTISASGRPRSGRRAICRAPRARAS
jgi:long-chain acyl-CoA synthetase